MSKITDVTRNEIFHIIQNGFNIAIEVQRMDEYERYYFVDDSKHIFMPFYGKLDELKFFDRLYNLDTLYSTDSRFSNATGDIWQHTVNNDDWENFWFIDYEPFSLRSTNDSILLKFLAEIFHPAVRDEDQPWENYLNKFNELLKYDGYQIIGDKKDLWKTIL